MISKTFSQLSVSIVDQVAEGNQVVTRFTWRGKNTGDFQGISPTNKEIEVSAVSIEKILDGKIAERWIIQDDLGLMRQLGAFPSP